MNLRALLFLAAFLLVFGAPLVASAHSQSAFRPFWGPILSCTGNYSATGSKPVVEASAVTKPCRSLCDMLHTFQHVMFLLITIALYAVTPLAIAVGGASIMFAGANPEMVSQGRKIIVSTVVGVVLILASYVIVQTMIYVLQYGRQLGGGTDATVQWGAITCTPSAK